MWPVIKGKYSVVQIKVTVLVSTSLAWLAWAGCSRAELFSQPGTKFFAQPCIQNGLKEPPTEHQLNLERSGFSHKSTSIQGKFRPKCLNYL